MECRVNSFVKEIYKEFKIIKVNMNRISWLKILKISIYKKIHKNFQKYIVVILYKLS